MMSTSDMFNDDAYDYDAYEDYHEEEVMQEEYQDMLMVDNESMIKKEEVDTIDTTSAMGEVISTNELISEVFCLPSPMQKWKKILYK